MPLSVVAVIGLCSGYLLSGQPRELLALICLACCALGLLWARRQQAVLVVILFLLLGVFRWPQAAPSSAALAELVGLELEVSGMVLEPPRQRGKSLAFPLWVERFETRPALGRTCLWVVVEPEAAIEPGERWTISGRLERPAPAAYPGAFDEEVWLRHRNIEYRLRCGRFRGWVRRLAPPDSMHPFSLVCRLRLSMLDRYDRFFEGRRRALLAGIVFGQSHGLDRELQTQFKNTGTTHLLAASGLNIALVVGLVALLGKLLGLARWRLAGLLMVSAWFYAALAGGSPSVVRAAALANAGLLALLLGRPSSTFNNMALATLAVLLVKPYWLLDVGFQLSLGAVLGIVLLGSPVSERWPRLPSGLVVTLAATLGVLPLLLWYFQQVAWVGLLANLIMGPLAEGLLIAGLVLAVVPVEPLAWVVTRMLDLLLASAAFFSRWGEPIYCARPTWWQMAAGFSLLVALVMWLHRQRGSWAPLLVGVTFMCWGGGTAPPTPPLRVRQVDLGAPVVWIEHSGRHYLVVGEDWVEGRARQMLRLSGAEAAQLGAEIRSGQLRCRFEEGRFILDCQGQRVSWTPLPTALELVEAEGGFGWREWK